MDVFEESNTFPKSHLAMFIDYYYTFHNHNFLLYFIISIYSLKDKYFKYILINPSGPKIDFISCIC